MVTVWGRCGVGKVTPFWLGYRIQSPLGNRHTDMVYMPGTPVFGYAGSLRDPFPMTNTREPDVSLGKCWGLRDRWPGLLYKAYLPVNSSRNR